jgi:glutathione S-transferase
MTTLYAMHGAGSVIAEIMFEELGMKANLIYPDEAERNTPAFRAISPYGRIPVLVTDQGQTIFESLAIVLTLLEYDEAGKLAPRRGTAEYAEFLSWITYLATTLYTAVLRYHYPERYGEGVSVRRKAVEEINLVYDHIEAAPYDFVAGDQMTVVDFYLYMLIDWDEESDQNLKSRSKINRIIDAVGELDSVKAVMARQDD